MDPKGSLFLKLLVNKFHPVKQDGLLALLPADITKSILSTQTAASSPSLLLQNSSTLFQKVHYSWLLEPLTALPKALVACVVASFDAPLQEKLQTLLSLEKKEYPDILKKYFSAYFLKFFSVPALPRELMGQTTLDALLDTRKEDLVILIDLLAMQDLAEEVRHIVDKKLIQAIIGDLTPSQQKYLQVCLHQKSKIPVQPLNVKETHKDRKAFHTLLHKRGLKRLSIATSGLSSDFMWHLSHLLDRGRGKILMEQWQKEELPLATQVIQMQIQQVLPILKGST